MASRRSMRVVKDDAALTADELEAAEKVISTGLQSFIEVGEALAHIRNMRLYLARYPTVEAYCKGRWGFSKARASQLTTAAEVVTRVYNCKLPEPANEAQARVLARLPASEQPKAWEEAVEAAHGGAVTAMHVHEVVARRLPAPAKRTVPVASVEEPPVLAALEALAAQRNADPGFASFRSLQRAVAQALPTRGQRMTDFIIDGGEQALVRLGLDWSVSKKTLQAAFHAKCLIFHPDRGGTQAEFVALTEAEKLVRNMLEESL